MADFEFKVTGLRETQKALYSYSQQLGDRVIVGALMAGARLISQQAKNNAPVKTGRLKKAIFVKKSKIYNGKFDTGKIGVYVSVRRGKKRGDLKGAYYANIVENGFNSRGVGKISKFDRQRQFKKKSGRTTNMGKVDMLGRHYMRDAFLSRRQAAVDLTIAAAARGAEIVKRKVGLR